MTLSSWLSPDSPTVPNYDLPPVPDLDRTHWGGGGGGGGGGWKGGKGNPNAALSALTLLAFLFFLNILQSCLKDTIGQNNGMMVMVLPANTTATNRAKREVNIDIRTHGEDSLTTHQNWTDLEIKNLIHTQVQSYWSNKGNKGSKNPLSAQKTKSKHVENNDSNLWDQKATEKIRISTKLSLKKEEKGNDTLDMSKMTQTRCKSLNTNNNLIHTGLIPAASKDNQLEKGFWGKTITFFINSSIPYIRKVICCSNIDCAKEENVLSTEGGNMIRKTMSWFCDSIRPVICGFYSTPCKSLFT